MRTTLAALLLFAPLALGRPGESDAAAAALTAKQHVMTLASPFFQGRAPGLRGNALAAEYVEFNFRASGLVPAFPATRKSPSGDEVVDSFASYRQTFRFGTNTTVTRQNASATIGNETLEFAPDSDVRTLGYSSSGEATGPAVFAGYAIGSGENGYTGFPDNTDLTGKIAVIFRFEPMNAEGKSLWSPGGGWTRRSGLQPKLSEVVKRKAAGVILINPPGADDPRTNRMEDAQGTAGDSMGVPIVQLSIEAGERLAKAAGTTLAALRARADAPPDGEFTPSDLAGVTATLRTEIDRQPILTDNVGGVVHGKGSLASQFIVIGAHYDHVGMGNFGSMDGARGRGVIHPGADDNASGTTGMMMLADRISKAYRESADDANLRSILFLGFTAEESGLIGSRHYTRNAIAAKEDHVFMINLDMIGRLRSDQPMEVHGLGTGEGLEEFTGPFLEKFGMPIIRKPGGLGPSDHASFYRFGVPVLFFFTGLHSEYHTPRDVATKIDPEGIVRVTDLVYDLTMAMASRTDVFKYVPGSNSERPSPIAQGTPAADQPVGATRSGVRFGIAPGDYSGSEKGVVVGEVYDDTPAAKGGLKKGDRMTKWNGAELQSVEAWMPILSSHKPGDKVTIVFVRDGQEMTTEVTLTARQQTNQ